MNVTPAWIELMTGAYRSRESVERVSPRFAPGATEENLARAEQVMKLALPDELRALLTESDGVMEVMDLGAESIETGWLVWPVEAISKEHSNAERRALGPPENWLVFGSPLVDGIVFGYDRDRSSEDIYAWHPIEARSQLMAKSLAGFLTGWLTGKLTV